MLKNSSVRTKVWSVISIMLIGLITVSVISIVSINNTSGKLITSLYSESYQSSNLILNADRDMYQALLALEQLSETVSDDDKDSLIKSYTENMNQVKDRMGQAQDILKNDASNWEKYMNASSKTIFDVFTDFNALFSDWADSINASLNSTGGLIVDSNMFDMAREQINSLTDLIDSGSQDRINNILAEKNTIIIVLLAVDAAIIAGSLILIAVILRWITRPLSELTRAANKIADGEIEVTMQVRSNDELGKLVQSFLKIIDNTREQVRVIEQLAEGDFSRNIKVMSENDLLGIKLNEMISKINGLLISIIHASEQVATESTLVSNSSLSLSQGATEQASSVQQLTASLDEVAFKTSKNAQNAEEANTNARKAKENAASGNSQMHDMLGAMEDISQSSSSISKIIKVIDDIAFQTNILSLNAAVEAARAGQHGKGFAVVAEEVRTLATRSANAAKETTNLIENSIRKVEKGTNIANETAAAFTQIVLQIDKAADLVNLIAAASSEQAIAIEQINQGISQVSQIVQLNAATAEESAAASEELSGQAGQLKETISVFKVKNDNKGKFISEPFIVLPKKASTILVDGRSFGKY